MSQYNMLSLNGSYSLGATNASEFEYDPADYLFAFSRTRDQILLARRVQDKKLDGLQNHVYLSRNMRATYNII